MKPFYYITGILFVVACTRQPEAKFQTNANAPIAGEEVRFTNTSEKSVSYEWDFGDGNTSTELHPDHVFENPGTYTVRLVAYSEGKKKMDDFALSIFVKRTTAQYVTANPWNLDSIVTNSYTDGELTSVSSTVMSDFYSSHTTEYFEDGTFVTNLDGSLSGGDWSVLLEEFSLLMDGEIVYIDILNETEFVFFRVIEFGGTENELVDSSYTYLSL